MVSELINNPSVANYAVLGNPVKHSKSPQIHMLFAKETGITLEYKAIEVPNDELTTYIYSFCNQRGKGLNITVPFKENAYKLCTEITSRALESGSVNTIKFEYANYLEKDQEGIYIIGATTDGEGFLNDLRKNYGINLRNKSILILGAGGTVKSIIARLVPEEIKNIVIVNRTLSRAEELEKKFKNKIYIKSFSYETLPDNVFDVIINGTSLSLSEKLPPISKKNIKENTFCYDLMYSDGGTIFTKWAIENGASEAVDGLGMLVEQAAESFKFWHGIRPDTKSVIKVLRDSKK